MATALDDIIIGLASPDWQQRRRAVERCLREESPELLRYLAEHLHDPNINVRNAIKTVLIRKRNPDLIRSQLEDTDPHVRIAATGIIGEIADRRTLPWLLDLLRGEQDGRVRLSLVNALHSFPRCGVVSAVLPLFETMDDEEKLPFVYLFADLGKDEPQVLPVLHGLLSNDVLRPAAIDALGNVGNDESARLLLGLLDEASPHLFAVTVMALARICERLPSSAREASMYDWNGSLRSRIVREVAIERGAYREATRLLLTLFGVEALPDVLGFLPHERGYILAELERVAQQSSAVLLQYLEDTNPHARSAVGYVIVRTGAQSAAHEAVKRLAHEVDPDVCRAILHGIYQRCDPTLQAPLFEAVEHLVLLQDSASLRDDVAATLIQLDPDTCREQCRVYQAQGGALGAFAEEMLARYEASPRK
jgi:HEAT repeat protein